MSALLGGIRRPEGALDPLVAAQTARSYPCLSSPSWTMLPTAAAAAEAEPEIAPNSALAPTLVTSRAPGSLPKIASTKSTSRLAMPPWFIRLPARTKKGMAVRLNLLMPTKVLWAAVNTDTSSDTICTMAARAEIPIA